MSQPAPEHFFYEDDPDLPGWKRWQILDQGRFNSFIGALSVKATGERTALVRHRFERRHSNLRDHVHGGALAGFIDMALFAAARGLGILAGPASTVDMSIQFIAGGAITSIGTMIVGATGPLVAALLAARGLTKQPLIATHATCMVVQHGLKTLAFGLLGFAYARWAPLLAAMIASGVMGTWVGTRLLDNIPDGMFRLSFKIVMTLLSFQIIWNALQN